MRRKLIFLIPIIAFTVCSCSAAQLNPKVSSENESATRLFSNAENFFRSNAYENALKTYEKFLGYYPSDSNADIALWRMATIYSNQRKYDLSLMTYQMLTAEYPHSQLAIDAMVEIMILLFNNGQFKEVILQASNIIEKTDSKTHLPLVYEVLGDTYMSLRLPKEAILFYQMAHIPEEKAIPSKLKTAANQLSKEDMLSLLTILNDQFLTSYLLFQLGLSQFESKNYKEALGVFTKFVTNFPHHEKKNEAQELIEKIHERLAFRRRVIGCLLPLTGPYEAFGNRALKGIQLALDQFNNQSKDPEFEIIVKDTASDPERAIKAVRQFDESRAALIIGPITTSKYAAQEAQIRGIPIITLTQKPRITEVGDFVFRIFLTPQMQIDTLVPYTVNQLNIKRFAVLYPEELYGYTFLKVFRDKVLDYGATLVAVESYKPEQTDFAPQIKKFLNTNEWDKDVVPDSRKNHATPQKRHKRNEVVLDFDAIFIPDTADKIAMIAPQLTFYDIDNTLLLGTNLWHSDNLIHSARDYVQEAIMADVFYSEDSKKNVQEFIAGFEEIHGQRPGLIEALAYDTAMINFYTLSNPKIQSRNDLKNELKKLRNFKGVTGYTSFDDNGDAVKKLYLLQIENNQFVQLNKN